MSIKLVLAYDSKKEVRSLFSEYTDMLVQGDSTFKEYLRIQNYDDELKHLEKKYGLPEGRLYLAYEDEKLAGCIGLKKIIDDAREIGYQHMLLDTLPFLESAIHMYRKYGFYEIESYNDSPMENSIYMKVDLD